MTIYGKLWGHEIGCGIGKYILENLISVLTFLENTLKSECKCFWTELHLNKGIHTTPQNSHPKNDIWSVFHTEFFNLLLFWIPPNLASQKDGA